MAKKCVCKRLKCRTSCKKKWGKIGAPKSAKRKAFLKRISKR